jgi:glycosyltransferase involved in cell wall biosynthesis
MEEMGSMPEPDISVIIPAFNAQRFIEESIGSALAQTDASFEVIVVDDGSDDDTANIAERMARADARLSVYKNEHNKGPSYARNRGISYARGRWIALLDGDDYFAPERLQQLLRIAEEQDVDLLADNITIVSEAGEPLGVAFGTEEDGAVGRVTIQKFLELNRPLAAGVKLGYVKPIMRREFLLRHGLRYKEDVGVGEDFLYYMTCLLRGGRFWMIPEPFYSYRLVEHSVTRSSDDAAGRTRQLMKANCALLEDRGIAQNQDLRSLVAKRAKEYDALLMYNTLVSALRRKDVADCVVEVWSKFRLVPDLLVVVVGALRRRFVVWRGGVSSFRGQRFRKVG